jgi:hypothetical protein
MFSGYFFTRLFSKRLLLQRALKFFIEELIAVEGARLLRDWRSGETLKSETYECGSPPAPRKASNLERKSTSSKNNKVYENSLLQKNSQIHAHLRSANIEK